MNVTAITGPVGDIQHPAHWLSLAYASTQEAQRHAREADRADCAGDEAGTPSCGPKPAPKS